MYELGEPHRVTIHEDLHHYFLDLDGDKWLAWQRKIAALTSDSESAKNARAIILAYDEHVERVEGYIYKGKDLMRARPDDWKNFIPGGHKVEAWVEFVKGDGLKKNS